MKKNFPKPIVFVSKCLGFSHCRYNGEMLPNVIIDKLKPFVEFKTACPEEAAGLGTPREPVRIIGDEKKVILYQPTTKKDWTDEMNFFMKRFFSDLGDVDGFIMKHRSPTCGYYNAKIYATKKANTHKNGKGIFAREILNNYSHSVIEDEGRLRNYTIRENFLIKIFTLAKFREVIKENKISSLTNFHAKNKYLFMAFEQNIMRKMGLIASNKHKFPINRVLKDYKKLMSRLLSHNPKEKSWINILTHMYGYFKKDISNEEKVFFNKTVEEYRDERIPLSVLFKIIESWAIRYKKDYILKQNLLEPFPRKLVEITDSGKGRSKGRD